MVHLIFPQAVQGERDFYDREKETERIKKDLLEDEQRVVIIMGERRIGKTSFMLVTKDRLAKSSANRFVPFFFSERWPIHSFKDFVKEVLQKFCKYLGKSLGVTGLLDTQGNFQEPNRQELTDALITLLKDTSQVFLICIDEFDIFLTQDKLPKEEALKILGWIHHVADGNTLPVAFFISMSREPNPLDLPQASRLTVLGDTIRLSFFSKENMIRMVRGLLGEEMVLDEEAIEKVYTLTAGHPFFVKLLLFHLLERYHQEEGAAVQVTQDMLDEELIRAAIRDHRATAAFRNVYEVHMGPAAQKLLLLVARYRQGIPRTGLHSLGAEYETAAKELVNRDYLIERPRGVFCYRIELLRMWVRQWERYDLECHRLDVETLKRMVEAEVIIDLAKREVRIKGEVRRLSPTVYCLLQLLCQRPDQLVTRNELQTQLDKCHGYGGDNTKIEVSSGIDVYISRLRGILGDFENDKKWRYISNIPRQGYILNTERLSILF